MAYTSRREDVTLEASASNLTTRQYHIVDLTGTGNECDLAAAAKGYGVLQNHPENDGEAATVAVLGESKAIAGGTITVGALITAANTGFAVVVASGAAHGSATGTLFVLGRARTSCASGGIFTVDIRPQYVAVASGAAFGSL